MTNKLSEQFKSSDNFVKTSPKKITGLNVMYYDTQTQNVISYSSPLKAKPDLEQSFKDYENRENITVHETVDELFNSLENSQSEDKVQVNEVEKATKLLREEIIKYRNSRNEGNCKREYHKDNIVEYSDNLVNALETQKTLVSGISDYTSKSIWKDVSELPRDKQTVYLISDGQNICISDVWKDNSFSIGKLETWQKFCSFTDFVNQHNQLVEDMVEIKKMLEKK